MRPTRSGLLRSAVWLPRTAATSGADWSQEMRTNCFHTHTHSHLHLRAHTPAVEVPRRSLEAAQPDRDSGKCDELSRTLKGNDRAEGWTNIKSSCLVLVSLRLTSYAIYTCCSSLIDAYRSCRALLLVRSSSDLIKAERTSCCRSEDDVL